MRGEGGLRTGCPRGTHPGGVPRGRWEASRLLARTLRWAENDRAINVTVPFSRR